MALVIDHIRFRDMFGEPERQPTPEEIASAKWLIRHIMRRAEARLGPCIVIEQSYDMYTKQATIRAEQDGQRYTFGHRDLSLDGNETFDGPHVPEWAR